MEKKKSDKHFIRQLILSMEDAEKAMKDSYEKKDKKSFERSKNLFLNLNDRIAEELE